MSSSSFDVTRVRVRAGSLTTERDIPAPVKGNPGLRRSRRHLWCYRVYEGLISSRFGIQEKNNLRRVSWSHAAASLQHNKYPEQQLINELQPDGHVLYSLPPPTSPDNLPPTRVHTAACQWTIYTCVFKGVCVFKVENIAIFSHF